MYNFYTGQSEEGFTFDGWKRQWYGYCIREKSGEKGIFEEVLESERIIPNRRRNEVLVLIPSG